MASKGFRQFWIMQYEVNPKTGEDLHFGESNIIDTVNHKTVEKYAYVVHDKDTKKEKMTEHPDVTVGDPIPRHWHIAIKCKNAVEIHTIAKWLGVPENFVEVPKGANAFLDCVEYLTHEHPKQQELGKYLYPDNEIVSNYDWRTELDLYKIRRANKGASKLNTKDYYRNEVLYHGMTLRAVCDADADAYIEDFQMLEKLRLQYMLKFAELPTTRINYYITGRGGVGKGLISRALARNLFPDLKNDDDIFFEVGGGNVTFEGYDGQPVIIWNDCRAFTLLQSLKGRENVFNVFDTHPTNCRQNVKFGSTRLINQVNIVNSVDSISSFLDGLAGEYKEKDGTLRQAEDKGQSYRRFPILIPLHEDDFDILLNKGVLEGTREYQQFVEHYHIRGNMQKIHQRLSGYEQQLRAVESQVVAPIVESHNSIQHSLSGGSPNENLADILADFADYGKQDSDACQRDEAQKFNDFIELQKRLIADAINNYGIDQNSSNYQSALLAQQMINNNPEEFYRREDLHLQKPLFMGAYRY